MNKQTCKTAVKLPDSARRNKEHSIAGLDALMILDANTIAYYCTFGDEQEEQMTRPSQDPWISGWTGQVFFPGFFRLLTSSGPWMPCARHPLHQNSPTQFEEPPQACLFDDSHGTKIPSQPEHPCFRNKWPRKVDYIIMSDENCRFSEQHREQGLVLELWLLPVKLKRRGTVQAPLESMFPRSGQLRPKWEY